MDGGPEFFQENEKEFIRASPRVSVMETIRAIKEYGNPTPRDVMPRFNLCRLLMALLGLAILLAVEACWP
jgi:hypothetical protein